MASQISNYPAENSFELRLMKPASRCVSLVLHCNLFDHACLGIWEGGEDRLYLPTKGAFRTDLRSYMETMQCSTLKTYNNVCDNELARAIGNRFSFRRKKILVQEK